MEKLETLIEKRDNTNTKICVEIAKILKKIKREFKFDNIEILYMNYTKNTGITEVYESIVFDDYVYSYGEFIITKENENDERLLKLEEKYSDSLETLEQVLLSTNFEFVKEQMEPHGISVDLSEFLYN